MRVLFLSALFPWPLASGGHVRAYNLLKNLGREHDITLFSYIRSDKERDYLSKISSFCRNTKLFQRGRVWQPKYFIRSMASSYPLLLASYALPEVTEALSRELRKGYDIVHCEPFYVASAVPSDIRQKLIITEHNIEYLLYRAYAGKYLFLPPVSAVLLGDAYKMKRWEERIWRMAHTIVCVSPEDRAYIRGKVTGTDIALVPNGVDCTYFSMEHKETDPKNPRFLFVGNFQWFPNTDACDALVTTVWPHLKRSFPGAVLRIVGPNAPRRLVRKAEKPGITMVGWVPDIRTEYRYADILVAPLSIGGGSKYKILEAMASGLPVVTSAIGAAGLDVRDRGELLLADTPASYVRQVDALLKDTTLRRTIVASARDRVERSFDWKVIARELSSVWEAS